MTIQGKTFQQLLAERPAVLPMLGTELFAVEQDGQFRVATIADMLSALGDVAVEDVVGLLDGGGKIITTLLPAITINQTFVVANQAAMLALTAEEGDVAIRLDNDETFILGPGDPTLLASWFELPTPTDVVRITRTINGYPLSANISLTKGDIGLGNVDNTTDLNKPISTLTQVALNGKEPSISAGAGSQYWRGDKTWQTLDKAAVGLSNVDNTSDANKPVSTATQTALNGKEPSITAGTTSQYWRGDKSWQTLNKAAVGLANVDNTSDANKPVSTAQQTALDAKEDEANKGVANGYASLDSGGKVPTAQLPSGLPTAASSVTFTPAGTIAATDVQAALAELDGGVKGALSIYYTHDGTSAANTIVLANNGFNSGTAAVDGQLVLFKVTNANTSTVTLRVLPHTAGSSLRMGGLGLATGALLVGDLVLAEFDGTTGFWNATILSYGQQGSSFLRQASADAMRTYLGLNKTLIAHNAATYVTNANITGTIPLDDTIPQSGEGTEIITLAHSAFSTTTVVELDFLCEAGCASSVGIIAALFRSGVANALEASLNDVPAGGRTQVACKHRFVPGTTSSLTYSVRVGTGGGTTFRLNGNTAGRYFGGVCVARLILKEFLP